MPQTTTWIGQIATAMPIAEIDIFTPGGTITTGDVNKLTITNQDGTMTLISFQTSGTTTATAVSAGLIAAWNASIQATALATVAGSSTVVLTGVTGGQPLQVASNVTGVGTLTKVTTTASSGPNDWGIAGNWSTGVVPGNGDTVWINGLAQFNISYGLNQTATGLTIYRTIDSSVAVGQANYGLNPGSGATVYEGQIPSGVNLGLGSARVKYACGTNAVTFYIYGTNTQIPIDAGRTVLQISGGASGTKIYVIGNTFTSVNGQAQYPPKVNVSMVGGDSGTVDAIDVSATGSFVNVGPAVTLGAFQASGGTCVVGCAITGALATTGSSNVTIQGSGAIGTATIGGYVAFNNRTGSTIITTLNVLPEALADFSQNPAVGTVTTTNQYASLSKSSSVRTFAGNPGHITFTTKNLIDGGTVTLST